MKTGSFPVSSQSIMVPSLLEQVAVKVMPFLGSATNYHINHVVSLRKRNAVTEVLGTVLLTPWRNIIFDVLHRQRSHQIGMGSCNI